MPVEYQIMTAMRPGAIGIVQLHGSGVSEVLRGLTAGAVPRGWGLMPLQLEVKAGRQAEGQEGGQATDEAVVAWLGRDDGERGGGSEPWCQIMPHGGVRVMQRLVERLRELGAEPAPEHGRVGDARAMYPEAATAIEADMLATLSQAASPAAINLLLDQPRRWAEAVTAGPALDAGEIKARSRALDRLLDPATVVVAGPPNVGKSTLTNRLVGRSASLTADLPGTTRDWVSAPVMLQPEQGGFANDREVGVGGKSEGRVAVWWLDTPGVQVSEDAIEQRAIALAHAVVAEADVVVGLYQASTTREQVRAAALGREPDVRVLNKVDWLSDAEADVAAQQLDASVRISASTGQGVDALTGAVLERLGLGDLDAGLWAFSATLRQALDQADALRRLQTYVGL